MEIRLDTRTTILGARINSFGTSTHYVPGIPGTHLLPPTSVYTSVFMHAWSYEIYISGAFPNFLENSNDKIEQNLTNIGPYRTCKKK